MEYIVKPRCLQKIRTFYHNVSKKYQYTYKYELMQKNITDAYSAIYRIENGLLRREPSIPRWNKYLMANFGKWYYAYTLSKDKQGKDIVTVYDACHAQNMHEAVAHDPIRIIKEWMVRLDCIS